MHNKYIPVLAEMYFNDFFSDKKDKKNLLKKIEKFIYKMNYSYCFVAKEKDEIVGVILAYLVPQADNTTGFLYIQSIEVLNTYRNKGIAKQLFSKTLSVAKKKSIDFVNLDVQIKEQFLVDWYSRLGFAPNEYKSLWANLNEIKI
jgi:ribosomal protein S18 acetylase RimI-like enzyme